MQDKHLCNTDDDISKIIANLQKSFNESNEGAKTALANMGKIIDESKRVIDVARNAPTILADLDAEFERETGLNKTDMMFLFLATALQCVRQYVLPNDEFRLSSNEGDSFVKKIVPKQWQDILLASVPYDAIRRGEDFTEETGLGGSTHRYRTLGHDPIMGWIFGPLNILSDSLTKTDIITSYSVQNMKICSRISTADIFSTAIEQIQSDKYLLPAAVVRQAIHFGSDYFTKQGLPLPFISSMNNDISKTLITEFNIDLYSLTRGAIVASLINALISCIHQLFYDKSKYDSRKLYEVKTRKIICYSNVIATTSNIIRVAIASSLGNKSSLKKLDLGGLLVTIHRIFSDIKFIGAIKREFIMEQFNEMIRGQEYDF